MATVVPRVSPDQAEAIALRHYGITGRAERLASEHDDTFRISRDAGTPRLLRVSVTDEGTHAVSLQTAILRHAATEQPTQVR